MRSVRRRNVGTAGWDGRVVGETMSDPPVKRPGNAPNPVFEVWKEYEAIAKHFNELIMNLRVQALGGVAAASTFVGIFFGKDAESDTLRWPALAVAFLVLAILWAALAFLDLFYYNRLLLGAADAISELEESSVDIGEWPVLNLSKRIRASVNQVGPGWRRSVRAPAIYYSSVFLALLAISVACYSQK